MRKEEIKELIQLVEESDIAELEVSEGRTKIRISKGGAFVQPFTTQPAAPVAPPTPGAGSDVSDVAGEEKLASNLKQITSPMVGTFYQAPAPGAEPFVQEGQTISAGQTVGIVEAMKLMNEIGSDFSGVVRKILAENAQPVEFGQPLFLVELT